MKSFAVTLYSALLQRTALSTLFNFLCMYPCRLGVACTDDDESNDNDHDNHETLDLHLNCLSQHICLVLWGTRNVRLLDENSKRTRCHVGPRSKHMSRLVNLV